MGMKQCERTCVLGGDQMTQSDLLSEKGNLPTDEEVRLSQNTV